ncbi:MULTISPECIES: hypothetical protein [Thioclava]|uniref:Uncharacterized protein n=1 Tax=Thioclava litoralis TaxID=3076557 RepID=A0ABZ1DV01_9RHOB|nr:hypothetical protein RPE78_07450 [Thioclava sp. FTW29]
MTPERSDPLNRQPDQPRPATDTGFGRTEMIAAALSVLWLVLVIGVWVFIPSGTDGQTTSVIFTVVGIFLPFAMIWVAALTAKASREMRAEAQSLRASVDAMRQAWVTEARARRDGSVEKKLDEIVLATRQTETALLNLATQGSGHALEATADTKMALVSPPPAHPLHEEQATFELGAPAEPLGTPVTVGDFVRALNFPDTADDREGFRALRRALEDRMMAKLIRAAQDVLNLLSQDGIYMDDLKPDRARPELWRRFAKGERGREVAALGGVRDRSSLALSAARMRNDTVFRDAAHHFLRQFDKTFAGFEPNATDMEIVELSDTRSARAFMLLGRVAGTFD